MKISEQEVENIAHLARLKMDDKQRQALCGHSVIFLGYMDKLAHVDVNGVAPASGAPRLCPMSSENVPQTSPGLGDPANARKKTTTIIGSPAW